MGLLDKLKPQPRWKHVDAAVRLEGVRELEDTADLAVLAESDTDGRVRRAALGKIDDIEVFGRVAASDPDADTRELASDRLVAVASRADGDHARALRAVAAIADPRRLSTLAKSEAAEAICSEALARITEEKSLGSVARHAKREAVARAALGRVRDGHEVMAVALNADNKDVALMAFDRVAESAPDLTTLRTIELRAQQRVVSRRARTMIQEAEAAEAARHTAALERQRREGILSEAVEALADVADVATVRTELARLNESWQNLGGAEPAAHARFQQAVAKVEATLDRRQREADEALERERQRAEAIATRMALCERVETLDGDDVVAQLVPIEEEWRSLLPLVGNGPEADRLAERFAKAVTACRKRHEMGAVLVATRTSIEALVGEAEVLVSESDTAAAAERWQNLSREARGLTAVLKQASRPADDLDARLRAVDQVFRERETAKAAENAEARQNVVTQLQRLTERASKAAEAETITLREGERLMRDIAAAVEAAGSTPAREIEQALTALAAAQERVAPRVRELREMDEWRKFANAQRQEQLISMAEAIVASLKAEEEAGKTSDLAATAKALRQLHTEWQPVAEAPRQSAQRLWDRFRTATDFMRTRCEPFFAKRREEREASRGKREALVTEAESLAASTDWAAAAARLQALQAEWQGAGRAATDAEREMSRRFRAACNAFFVRRREDLTDRKRIWSDNLAKKEALVARAEELAQSTEWDAAAAEMKKLQADWKTVGPVRKNKSDQVWNRFRAAADQFFERYHHRHEIALASKLAEREVIVVELEALAGMSADSMPPNAAAEVQRVRTTWNRAVPVPVPGMKALNERWQSALGRLLADHPTLFAGTELDPAAVVSRMEKLVQRVESLASSERQKTAAPTLSPTELLAAKLRSALAANAMGGRSHDESKARSGAEAVKDAQASWQRLPPVNTPEARALEARFRDACRRMSGGEPARRNDRHDRPREQRPPSAPLPVPMEAEAQPEPATV
jgi:hypothetical protein